MRPLRIAIINLYTEAGGGEIALLHLLKEIDRERFEPIMIFNGEGPFRNAVKALGITTEDVPFTTVMLKDLLRPSVLRREMKGARALASYLAKAEIDVVHCSDVLALLLLARARLARNFRIVYNVIFRYEWPRMILFNLLALPFVRRIVANSDATEDDLTRRTLFLSRRTTVIRPGVDPALFRPLKAGEENPLKGELGVPPRVQLVGMAGRFDPAKGHLIFLRAAAEIVKRRKNVRFVIAGGTMNAELYPAVAAYHQACLRYCHEAVLDEAVTFLGHRDDMPSFFRSLDVAVCPSVSEGFGLTVVEALASGAAVVASTSVGAAELVRKESDFFPAEAGDAASFAAAIEQALDAGSTFTYVSGSRTRAFVANARWNRFAREYEDVYSRVAGNPPPHTV